MNKESIYKGLPAVILENDRLALTFLPTYGCKLASLIKKDTGREFLFQSPLDKLTPPPYGAAFSAYDSSGFDEVFPSIDACPYPFGKHAHIPIPDHGEIWALPWKHTLHKDGLGITAEAQSPILPYKFIRKLTLQGPEIRMHYTVENLDHEPLEFIWTPHCLLACSTATVLVMPEKLKEIMTVEHSTRTLGPWGSRHTYPITTSVDGKQIDMSRTQPITDKSCEKFYFTTPNKAGWCGIKHTDNADTLTYRYDADKVPYLAIWKTQGGYRGDYNIALEPCTGEWDDLYVAHKIRRAAVCPPNGKYEWNFTMIVGQEK